MYYSYVEIEYVATSFSPARTDLALKLLTCVEHERIAKTCLKQPVKSCTDVRKLTGEVVLPSPDTMASMYERVPLYKVVKAWEDNNPNLSECYVLQSKDPQNKRCTEIHKDKDKYGIEFTIDKTIPEFN